MKNTFFLVLLFFTISCKDKLQKTKPQVAAITESIYASGIIKSKNQYQAFVAVNGIVDNVFVTEGDNIKKGETILTLANEFQKLNKENAQLAATFSDFELNKGKLKEAKLKLGMAKSKLTNDSALYFRQKSLWQDGIGTKIEFEQRDLAFQNSKTLYDSYILEFEDLKRQLKFASLQSKKNLKISNKLENDYVLKSHTEGIVYSILKEKGEIVTTQTPVAVIGSGKEFILEMQVDEYDIFKVKIGQVVIVTLDSYKGKVFEAKVSKIYPIMNERSKTFLVEAIFENSPSNLYPNITFEANIIQEKKEKALLIPRMYLFDDSIVYNKSNEKIIVKTGLKDYNKVEILSGIDAETEITIPKQ